MTKTILNAIKAEGIECYILRAEQEEREEAYYVRKKLDTLRSVKKNSYTVTVYRDSAGDDGEELRGAASVLLFDGMSEEEIRGKLRDGYSACAYSYDRAYPLPKAETSEPAQEEKYADARTLARACARAIYEADTLELSYVCSCEIFVSRIKTTIISSEGTHACFERTKTWCECVVTCKEEEDVELYDCFELEGDNYGSVTPRIRRLCEQARDRSRAKRSLGSITTDLIIEADALRDAFGIFLWKTDAKNVHAGYSELKRGELVLPEGSISIDAQATLPFDREGVRMISRTLISDGRVASFWGSSRWCSYIGEETTGEYEKLRVRGKCTPLSEMKKTPHLHVVSFSDFQADPLDGYIGGEIRLGYYFDGERTQIVTGVSVSANLARLSDGFEISEEQYESASYSGPLALRISGASVSGCDK